MSSYGKSTLAHGCTCAYYQKNYLKLFKKMKKYFDIYVDILCSFTEFREKMTFFVASVKRMNFGAPTLLFT
jgi:hypothetical protein